MPVVHYDFTTGYHANPAIAAQYGFWAYGTYLKHHGQDARKIVLRVADWLVEQQQLDGRWTYGVDLPYVDVTVEKPWASALAQGQGMSLLERAFRLTGDERYRRAAIRALRPLQVNVRDGGLMRCFRGDCRRPFYEEAPTSPPSYILNGFMYALVGLYDLASIAPKSPARSMYAAGRRTLDYALPLYDRDGLSSYDLFRDERRLAPQGYQAIHVYLLRTLDSIRRNGRFALYASRWQSNLPRAPGP